MITVSQQIKEKQINIAHRTMLLEAQAGAGDWVPLSWATRIDEFQPCPGPLWETWIKRRCYAWKQLSWYISLCICWFNLWHSNALSDLTCRAATRAHPGWFLYLSIARSLNLFPFLGLLKHVIQHPTLSSRAKAIHYSMPQSTGCLCNRITRAKQV